MRIVIAPNSFKESLSAIEAAKLIEEGISRYAGEQEILLAPVGDGGDGTLETLFYNLEGERIELKVKGPLFEEVVAYYGIFNNGRTAFIEMALASGLKLVPKDKRNPMRTTSYGTGEMIRDALDHGVEEVIVGVGGSATVDGGIGALSALGIRFLDEEGKEVEANGSGLLRIKSIDLSGLDKRVHKTKFYIASDVTNPLLGESGAARVYGPQKGATPEMVMELERGLLRLAEIIENTRGIDVKNVIGGGAAGGISASFYGLLDARIESGIELVLDLIHFDRLLEDAGLVITSEGKIDRQTLFGKGPYGVMKRAKERGVPVVVLCGEYVEDDLDELLNAGFDMIMPILNGPLERDEAILNAGEHLFNTSKILGKFLSSWLK